MLVVKKAKPKPRTTLKKPAPKKVERKVSQPKAALRSEAFARALADAKAHANDPERLRVLFEEAARKAAAVPRDPFEDSWPYVQAMLRLVRAYFRGEYRNVSQERLLWIITALNYSSIRSTLFRTKCRSWVSWMTRPLCLSQSREPGRRSTIS